jgi:hypothetical protein
MVLQIVLVFESTGGAEDVLQHESRPLPLVMQVTKYPSHEDDRHLHLLFAPSAQFCSTSLLPLLVDPTSPLSWWWRWRAHKICVAIGSRQLP